MCRSDLATCHLSFRVWHRGRSHQLKMKYIQFAHRKLFTMTYESELMSFCFRSSTLFEHSHKWHRNEPFVFLWAFFCCVSHCWFVSDANMYVLQKKKKLRSKRIPTSINSWPWQGREDFELGDIRKKLKNLNVAFDSADWWDPFARDWIFC